MFTRSAALSLVALTLLAALPSRSSWADGERGTKAETAEYAAREAGAPALQEFAGGVGGILAAIVHFFSDAIEAIVEFFGGGDEEPAPAGEQGWIPRTGAFESA